VGRWPPFCASFFYTNLKVLNKFYREARLKSSVPDPGCGAFLTLGSPGSEIGKKSGFGSGMNNPDHISESLETIFGLKYLSFNGDPGWKKFGSGIRDKHPGAATLLTRIPNKIVFS
jgi:hypothetical protein